MSLCNILVKSHPRTNVRPLAFFGTDPAALTAVSVGPCGNATLTGSACLVGGYCTASSNMTYRAPAPQQVLTPAWYPGGCAKSSGVVVEKSDSLPNIPVPGRALAVNGNSCWVSWSHSRLATTLDHLNRQLANLSNSSNTEINDAPSKTSHHLGTSEQYPTIEILGASPLLRPPRYNIPFATAYTSALYPRWRPTSETISTYGHLGKLPVELLWNICDLLPLPDLLNLRATNLHARHQVQSIPTFERIIRYCPQAIRGVMAIESSVPVTLPLLYSKLQRRNCEFCPELAQHIWLPTLSRICLTCSEDQPIPFTERGASGLLRLEGELLRNVPSFWFIGQNFTNGSVNVHVNGEHRLFDGPSAIVVARDRARKYSSGMFRQEGADIRKHVELNLPGSSYESELPPVMPRASMATIMAPWITSGGAELGLICALCQGIGQFTFDRSTYRLYTRKYFIEHLKNCRVRPLGPRMFLKNSACYGPGRLRLGGI
ncbi:hypothetical protein BDV96DRAFT_666305 [Lophiotrema nucula]|uniref:F-box domain-containing protein n=1 Tax=Lophiotrema nucula TaxID=690887 RepID=A0A6A5YYD9_9PLEO|nr:hypothetical protein BDV96DRAFT_666305 [Lophiotrema nucula]